MLRFGVAPIRRRVGSAAVTVAIAVTARDAFTEGTPTAQPQRAETTPSALAAPYPAPNAAGAYYRPDNLAVMVRPLVFDADDPNARLEWLYGPRRYLVCAAHCTLWAGVGSSFRVSGSGIRASRAFRVYPNPGPLFVQAEARKILPGVLVTVGAGLAILMGGASLLTVDEECANCSDALRDRAQSLGWGLLIGGVLVLPVGIVLVATNRTQLHFGRPRGAMPVGAGAGESPVLRLGSGFELVPSGLRF